MPQSLKWKDLRLGLVGTGVAVGLALVILLFARVGGVRGKKVTLYVVASTATGVLKGTEVTVGGKRAGTVETIRFLPPSADTAANILLVAHVLERSLPLLRRDSYAQLKPSGTIIGAPVLDLIPGRMVSAGLRAGDTLRARPQIAPETLVERVGGIGRKFGAIRADLRSAGEDVRAAKVTFAEISPDAPRQVPVIRQRAATLTSRISAAPGSRALLEAELGTRVGRVLAAIDTIGSLLESDRASIGRFRRDRTLSAEMARTSAELTAIRGALSEAQGTGGRLQHDRAISMELSELQNELDLLVEDVTKNPFRYIIF